MREDGGQRYCGGGSCASRAGEVVLSRRDDLFTASGRFQNLQKRELLNVDGVGRVVPRRPHVLQVRAAIRVRQFGGFQRPLAI